MGEHRTKLFWKIKSEPHTENAALGEHRDFKTHHAPQLATLAPGNRVPRNACWESLLPPYYNGPRFGNKNGSGFGAKRGTGFGGKKWYNFGTKNGSRFETSL